eukprot:30493-Amphidinium_carterae.2
MEFFPCPMPKYKFLPITLAGTCSGAILILAGRILLPHVGQPPIKKASNCTIAKGERVAVKLWRCMRKDDLLAADLQNMRLTSAGISLTLRQKKTTGPAADIAICNFM